ncbi:unnamed protein product [Caenorhabditis auriculariae]|uniref:Ammonium transporter n=1 Tax=Caenorhabditis auriculariae TaxID=2777116 RepID=A0A8S1HA10_9PELO|nr:unnamed protein product [Caenorhabditis auriculariae]
MASNQGPAAGVINVSTMQIVQIHHYAETMTGSEVDKLYQDDAVWIITSSFIIFTMHSGFGLLESGSVSAKDEVNIMVKNVVDVVFGGLSYWSLGYGLSYGDYEPFRNPYIGFGKFFYDPTREYGNKENVNQEGWSYAAFLFQLSLATTASTIVSGAVAERAKLKSYILLGCIVILIQAAPAHWVWDKEGFFYKMGVVDFAGCSAVHMVGGIIGLIATVYLKPRRNRFNEDSVHQMSSPTNALLGTFLLWWGWFGINAGSVWGITGGRWRLGARAAVATIMSSIGGGATAITISFVKTKKLQVNYLINGILSSIVSITGKEIRLSDGKCKKFSAMCAVSRPWHALVIGSVSSVFSIMVLPVLERLHIDDPVGIVPIHLTSSIWGMLAVGIFCEKDKHLLGATNNMEGLLYSWSFKLLGVQALATVVILVYSAACGLLVLFLLSKSPLGLRVTDYEEQIGADVIEHGLAGTNVARYVIEKPLSTRTFQTVTKAITKWKMLAKQKSRQKRMEMARLKRLEEEQQSTQIIHNGGTSNGNVLHHRKPSITGNGRVSPPEERRAPAGPLPNGSATSNNSRRVATAIQMEPIPEAESSTTQRSTSRGQISHRSPITSPKPEETSGGPKKLSVVVVSETNEEAEKAPSSPEPEPDPEVHVSDSSSNVRRAGQRIKADRPATSSNIGITVRPGTSGKFVRSPAARPLSPSPDLSMDQSPPAGPSFGKRSNRVGP